MWLSKRRKIRAVRLHLSAVADRIDARAGTVLKEESTGGLSIMSSPIALIIITLRHGTEEAVTHAQIDAALAAGYTQPPKAPCSQGRGGCIFSSQMDLPRLSIVTYPSGQKISHFGAVPGGHTGVIVSLH